MTASTRTLTSVQGFAGARPAREERPESALLRLLRYVPKHKRYAALTVAFGVLGFSLSFVYPWLIGNAIDVVIASRRSLTSSGSAGRQLIWLTGVAAVTGVLHALALYGRGHYNVRLGDGIVLDLRRQLFAHLQRLSVGFYSRERTGTILSRV